MESEYAQVDHAYLKQAAAAQYNGSVIGAKASQETELSSLLSTIREMAYEARGITTSILDRVSPQCENECTADKAISAGYVGRAEEIRSVLSETIRLLGTLSKLA